MPKTYTITVADDVAANLEKLCARMNGPSIEAGKTMTPEELLSWLADDAHHVEYRPGSWEGAMMHELLVSHGFLA